jgi:hypothetical protein
VPVKPDLKVGDDGPTRETPEDAAKASGEFSPADFKDYIEPELNKMRPQDTSWQDAMRRADKQAEEIEAQGVKDDPERMPTEPDVVVPTPELKMPTAAPSFQDKEPIKDIGVQKTDIEPMSPEDAKEPTYQAAPTQQTTDNSGGSGGGGNSGRGTPNMRNGFESRAPGPGEAGMGSFGRCFV